MHPMTQIWTAALPAFLASLVEFVEALTIVLAVGITRGWRPALGGSIAAAVLLAALVLVFGPFLSRFPITWLQIAVGVLLILFGMRWLRKAILRAGHIVATRDEQSAFEHQKEELAEAAPATGFDAVGFLTAFKAVTLEGLEVVFIVIAVGATANALVPASIGALAAGVLVVSVGIILQQPLSRVPENSLKFAVGILLSAFGTFWFGEGLGMRWPGEDIAILGLIIGYAIVSFVAVALSRRLRARAVREMKPQPT